MDKSQAQKDKRAAKRAAKGVTASTYVDIEENPTVREAAVSQTQKQRFEFIRGHFEGFYAYQAESDELGIFPPNTTCAEDFFRGNQFHLDFGCLQSFVRYYAAGVEGAVSLSGNPILRTVLGFWASVAAYVKWKVGSEMSLLVFEQVRQFIKDELATELGDAHRKLGWLMRDDIRALAERYLDVNFQATTMEARINMLAWQNLTVQNNIRRSALVKSEQNRADQRALVWGDCEIRIVLPEVQDKPPIPFIFFTTPNSKNKASANTQVVLEPTEQIWEDPVHHILLLASMHSAFPTGWTYEEMYDRNIVEQRTAMGMSGKKLDHIVIRFNKDKWQTPVFQAPRPYSSVTAGCIGWTSKQFYRYMKEASLLCGFDSTVGPHVLRRSGVNAMKVAGATNSEITQQLRQKWSAFTFQRYTGDLIVTDATSAVYDQPGQVQDLLQNHEKRVKRNRVPPLPRNILSAIFQEPSVMDLMDQADVAVKSYISQLSISCQEDWSKWPKELEHVRQLCEEAKKAYNARLCLQRRRFYGSTATKVKVDQGAAHEHHQSIQRLQQEQEENDDGSSDVEDLDEYNEEDDEYAEGIDNFPAPETIGFNVLAFEQFTTQNELSSEVIALDNALDCGSEEQRASLFHSVAIEPITDAVIDPALLAISAVQTLPIGVTRTSSSTVQATSSAVPVATIVEEAQDNPLSEVNIKYFVDNDRFGAFEAVLQLPRDYHTLYSFRPGHGPIDNKCRFCGIPLHEIIGVESQELRRLDRKTTPLVQTHVNKCAATLATEATIPTLLSRYSNRVTRHHILDKKMIPKKKPGKHGGPDLVYNLKLNIQQLITKNLARQQETRCLTCLDKPIMHSLRFAEDHLLVVHGIWLGPIANNDPGLKAERATGVWNARVAGFPLAPYSTHTGRYHPDPLEYALLCRTIIQQRITDVSLAVDEYGIRTDIVIPEGSMQDESQTAACDEKYDQILGRCALVVQDGLCIICANDSTLSDTQRAQPRCNPLNCLHRVLHPIQLALDDPTEVCLAYIWAGSKMVCPDPVCGKKGRDFDNVLDFTKHLVAIHRYPLRGVGVGKDIDTLTFSTLDEAKIWARGLSASQGSYDKAKKRSRSGSAASQMTGISAASGGNMTRIDHTIAEENEPDTQESSHASKRSRQDS